MEWGGSTIWTREGGILAGGETAAGESTAGPRGGDGKGGETSTVEDTRNDFGEGTGDLREAGDEVESTSTGAVDWGEPETDEGGGLSGNPGDAHVVSGARETVESSWEELGKDRTERIASLVAEAVGSVYIERTSLADATIEARSERLNDTVERVSAVLRPRGWKRRLPLHCRLRVSGSNRKRGAREKRTNGERQHRHR